MPVVLTVEELGWPSDSPLVPALQRLKVDLERTLSADQIDALREMCSDLLLDRGSDEDYDPTPEGRQLEDLIDRLFLG